MLSLSGLVNVEINPEMASCYFDVLSDWSPVQQTRCTYAKEFLKRLFNFISDEIIIYK